MDALKNILFRNSTNKLGMPYPNKKEMELIYRSALRAPDHRGLKPSRFIEVTGKGRDKLSKIFENYAKENIKNISELQIEKYKKAPYRAPMVIVLISDIKNHPKVPEIEQILSTGAAAQNILLALNAMGYGCIWRTGIFALNKKISNHFNLNSSQMILGYLYIGTTIGEKKKLKKERPKDYVTIWET